MASIPKPLAKLSAKSSAKPSVKPTTNATTTPKKYYKKYNPNVQKYVNWDQYDNDKLDTITKYSSKNHPSFTMMQPMYKYTNYMTDTLYYKTPFIRLTQDVISKYTKDIPEFMNIDLNDMSIMSTIISFLESYDKFIFKEFNKSGDKYTHIKTLLNNTGYNDYENFKEYKVDTSLELKKIPLYFIKDKQSGNIISEIINYNVAKKYPKTEVFNATNPATLDDMKRFLKKGKEVRFILKPYSWINKTGNSQQAQQAQHMAGSKIQIVTMEIKYDFANIDSIVDQEEVVYQKSIKEIEI